MGVDAEAGDVDTASYHTQRSFTTTHSVTIAASYDSKIYAQCKGNSTVREF